ncbi:MAG: hypothetical protein AAGI37_03245 [Planctomycetota bacterium]
MDLILLIADRNSPVNAWLRENPLVLSAGFTVLGIILLYFGVVGLKTGETRDKYGIKMTGGIASLASWARAIAGVAVILVAVYIAFFGAW